MPVVSVMSIPQVELWNHHHHNHFTALFPGFSGWAGARRELLDFMVQGNINRGRHTDHPAGLHSIRTNQCPPPPSPHFLQARWPSCHPTNSVKALKAKWLWKWHHFYRSYASAVLEVVILSVCPSVGLAVCYTCALWLIKRTYRQYVYTTWKVSPSSFLLPKISLKFQPGHPDRGAK